MAYITTSDYLAIVGEAAPPDFNAVLTMAEDCIDAHTLYAYVGRDVSALPEYVRRKLKAAVAYQVQYIVQMGGVAGANDGDFGSVTLGKFSYSQSASGRTSGSTARAGTLSLCNTAAVNVPFLLAYARGAF